MSLQVNLEIIEIILSIVICLILYKLWKIIYKKLINSNHRLLNLGEFLPDEEIQTLRQVFYLAMMLFFFILILYLTVYSFADSYIFAALDVLVSFYLLTKLEINSNKRRLIGLLLLPLGSITFLVFDYSVGGFLDMIHVPVFIYFMKVYYDKFKEYTENNGLGIAIVLLFSIIFISFIITTIVENVSPLDSLVMVSNAFTSNGYAVLGKSPIGKLNSVFLVWGGYVLSSVGTATLTAAILTRHFNHKFDRLEKLIEEKDKN